LAEEKINKLNQLDFTWKLRELPKIDALSVAARWDQYFNELKMFRTTFGHLRVPCSKNKKLHSFMRNQRAKYNKGTLGNARTAS
jgi:hypothetical protein